jgi:hypothetical protein
MNVSAELNLKSKNNMPPKLYQQFLNSFLREELLEEVKGDLDGRHYNILKEMYRLSAKMMF